MLASTSREATDRGNDPIDPGGASALVAPHPVPRRQQERRVIDEVEHIIEATARIGRSPNGAASSASRVPVPRPPRVDDLGGPRIADIHQRVSFTCIGSLRNHAGPLRHVTGFPGLGLLRALRPCRRHRSATDASHPPRAGWLRRGTGARGRFPRSLLEPFDGIGIQLCPCTIAMATPQAFTVASRTGDISGPRVPLAPPRLRRMW